MKKKNRLLGPSTSPGLCATLLEAAKILTEYADELRRCCTVGGRGQDWCGDLSARDFERKIREVVKRLRKAEDYHRPNPMGGPAKMFDVMADCIRAGDPVDLVIANYGLRWVKTRKK